MNLFLDNPIAEWYFEDYSLQFNDGRIVLDGHFSEALDFSIGLAVFQE